MGTTIEDVIYPTFELVVLHNKIIAENSVCYYVGKDNVRYKSSLEWVLDAIQYPLFGIYHFPTLFEKAAQLCVIIIKSQIFFEGNKRTAMYILETFLYMNNFILEATKGQLVKLSMDIFRMDGIKNCQLYLVNWLESHCKQV